MSDRTTVRRAQAFDALLDMLASDGASPRGQVPPAEYVEAVRDAPPGRAEEVAEAHRNNAGPPDFAGGGNGNSGGNGGGPS